MNFLIKILLSAAAVIAVSYILPGVKVNDFLTALILAVILSFLNFLVKPVLVILTIPLTIVTLGLFLLVINAVIILLADSLVAGFEVKGFWWALLFSLLLSIANSLLTDLSKKRN